MEAHLDDKELAASRVYVLSCGRTPPIMAIFGRNPPIEIHICDSTIKSHEDLRVEALRDSVLEVLAFAINHAKNKDTKPSTWYANAWDKPVTKERLISYISQSMQSGALSERYTVFYKLKELSTGATLTTYPKELISELNMHVRRETDTSSLSQESSSNPRTKCKTIKFGDELWNGGTRPNRECYKGILYNGSPHTNFNAVERFNSFRSTLEGRSAAPLLRETCSLINLNGETRYNVSLHPIAETSAAST